ncbi:hypothetical protein RhiirA4_456872 [Rhizophagus irregularis]|uniref:Kelch-like protein 17 n=1 Tax=Rhizophagus irregularis TaxID=588596 RepID=A0A2I1G8Q1_9GLOM|nr:hypothetical protein RhiirA4_456872 [Rhizophagus irregularis]
MINFCKILNDHKYYDITIKVGNDPYVKIFRAHMVILNYRSTYLQRILSANKKKNDGTLVHSIRLLNISPEIFQNNFKVCNTINRYIYGGKLSLKECDISDIIKILIAASELNLQELVNHLQLYIIKNNENWMEENFNLVYQTSFENHSFLELQKYCTDFISKRPNKILKSISFSLIPEKLLNPELSTNPATFSKDDFNVLKNTLQHLIPFIKFNNLTSREFSNEVLPYKKVLPKELYKDLLNIFLNLHPDSGPNDKSKIQNINSKIITSQHAELISKWIAKLDIMNKSTPLYEFKLILHGSRDGFGSNIFHEVCDNRSCTITIIKVKGNNQILGGYNPIEWKSDRSYGATKDSFIYGVDIDEHILSRTANENYAIFNDHTYRPSFGDADLILRGENGHCIKDSYEKQIRGPSSESALHFYYKCDCCTACMNFDLCQDCKPKSYVHDHPNDHVFQPITYSHLLFYSARLTKIALAEINSINNNHNVTLINDDTPDNTNETALTPSKSITKHMPKRRKIDPVWDFIDDTDNNNLVNFATKNIPSEQIFSVVKHTISPARNRLSTENVRANLCLKTWYETNIIKNYSKNQ